MVRHKNVKHKAKEYKSGKPGIKQKPGERRPSPIGWNSRFSLISVRSRFCHFGVEKESLNKWDKNEALGRASPRMWARFSPEMWWFKEPVLLSRRGAWLHLISAAVRKDHVAWRERTGHVSFQKRGYFWFVKEVLLLCTCLLVTLCH